MSFSYDRYDTRRPTSRRTTLGYWVPLILTVTVASAGLAAWIWSERQDSDDPPQSSDDELSYGEDGERQHGPLPSYGTEARYSEGAVREGEDGFMARMSGAIRRTPSPQQVFDSASRKVAAGVAAAGAVVGGALSSIQEEDKDAYGDHNRWDEERARRGVEAQSSQSAAAVETQVEAFGASMRGQTSSKAPAGGRRKTVAVVLSADSPRSDLHEEEQGAYHTEHASLLSHLPAIDPSTTRLFILIYAPSLKTSRPSSSGRLQPTSSLGSPYSAITTPAQTPGEELASLDTQYTPAATTPALSAKDADSSLYHTVHAQALRLLETPTMVMPFTTPTGHVHILRHLAPDIVYLAEALSGENGKNVEDVKNWVGQVVVVVGGDAAGLGGLVDTEDEGEEEGRRDEEKRWWEESSIVGLGKGVEVCDGIRVGEDWERRVGGRE
ncbi:hypothetical protein W97_09223 [Coniosporium apollinis CBS 100218]|uniref:Peroxin-22-like protein Pex22-like-Penicillium chrysogenum n=1 Tax=Coniosporium apollinis (strain CBS 100218) TaxID=1168221 RepID=R7Z772_CONA1|nr:uncharacterized protein W97_09223 [Coniosporium apollinis CBS 100218]EON69958.1 hypothetical protein W97_09223 [Coniosporium apollinis CBS 100218]